MELTDGSSVEDIRLRAPALSSYDAEFIQDQMILRRLFPQIRDPSARQGITSRLLAIEQPILTIYSLFKDLRYLQPPLGMIRVLIPKKFKGTLREALYFYFSQAESAEDSFEIQVSERSYSTFSGSSGQFFDLAVRQLFLYAIRRSAKPPMQRIDIYSTFGLAELAKKLGFSSAEIDSVLKNDPYQRMVLDLISRILPNRKAADIQTRTQSMVRELRELVDTLGATEVERFAPWATVTGLGEPISRRCGPAVWAGGDGEGGESEDLNHIFLNQMHVPLAELQRGGQGISSFYVKRSIYLAFFGDLHSGESLYPHLGGGGRRQGRATGSIFHHAPLVEQPAGAVSGLSGRDSNSHGSSQGPVTNQLVPSTGRIITFMENGIPIREVPYEKNSVNFQAREYADQGKKLHVPEGPHFVWEHCFDILTRTRSSTVLVSTVVRQINRKRQHSQIMPGQFPSATRETSDFEVGYEDDETS
jgi:hypothetical protein